MSKLVITLILLAALLTLASLEQVFITNVYKTLKADVLSLEQSLLIIPDDAKGLVNSEDNKAKADKIYTYWLKHERNLAMLARHNDLSIISDSIIYVKNFVYYDNKEEAMVGILKLKYLIDTHSFNVGTSVQNVI